MKRNFLLISTLLATTLLVSGCAVNQKLALTYKVPPTASQTKESPKVKVIVNDKRSYILNGEKPNSYIGTYRAGLGMPYDVNTKDLVPLATIIQEDMKNELISLGFIKENGQKTITIDIITWKFDAYQNAYFDYQLIINVSNQTNSNLVTSTVQDKIRIEGSAFGGGKAGVERDLPKIYTTIIQNIVRNNSNVLKVLH